MWANVPRGDEGDVPAVGVLRRDPQRALLAAAADPDRQLGLHRLGLAARRRSSGNHCPRSRDLVAQQAADALDAPPPAGRARLRGAGTGCRRRRTRSGSSRRRGRGRPARPTGDRCADRVGQHRRMAVADRVDERAAADTRGVAGQRGVRGHRLQALRVVAQRWRRRSGPRSRSSRSRGPRCGATGRAASSMTVFCRPACTPKTVWALDVPARLDRRVSRCAPAAARCGPRPSRLRTKLRGQMPPCHTPRQRDRDRVRDLRRTRGPRPAPRHGLHRPDDRLGRATSAGASSTAAST